MSKSPAYKLFNVWVAWLIPEYANLSSYQRKEVGLFLPEDPKKANAILLNTKKVFLSAAQAAEYMNQCGGYLAIADPTDAIKVYTNLMEHLANWLRFMESPQLITKVIPIEGLNEFNQLANLLFPVAYNFGYYKKPEVTMSQSLFNIYNKSNNTRVDHKFNNTIMNRINKLYNSGMYNGFGGSKL